MPNVGELDADKDGFSNKEEFEKGTNPKDADSHPPFTDKLFLVQRTARNYIVVLKSSSPPYQVSVTTPDLKKKGWFVEEGKAFGIGDRFKVEKFEKKIIPDPKTGEKDMSELVVEDSLTKKKLTLVKDVEINLAEFECVLEFRLHGLERLPPLKKGDTFRIPGLPDTTYKVIDILEDNAVVSALKPDGTTEKEIIIKKG
ncbi:MAG: Amuc_1099 family pilus-like system protein [Pseudomonadota bacterium]